MRYATLAVNELPYSLLTRAIELEALPQCRAGGVGVIGYMTLLQGLLADIYPTLQDVPPHQRRTRHFHYKSRERSAATAKRVPRRRLTRPSPPSAKLPAGRD